MSKTEQTLNITLRTRTKVLPGKRVEFFLPELEEGAEVEIEIKQCSASRAGANQPRKFRDVVEFLDSLPNRCQTPEDIERIENEIDDIKNAWTLAPAPLAYLRKEARRRGIQTDVYADELLTIALTALMQNEENTNAA